MKKIMGIFIARNGLKSKLIIEILAIFLISIIFLFIFSSYVPFNMDEFLSYHTLASHYYHLNKLNTFREGANAYDLVPFPNLYLPLRSFGYVGIVHDIIYYPLFKLWPSPYSARFLGLIMLIIQAYFINKIFKINILISFIFLLSCMPYVFQHLVDTGPVTFHLTSIFCICYLAHRWVVHIKNGYSNSWRYPLVIGLILFLGIWAKLAYFFILPAIIILIFYYIISSEISFKNQPMSKILIRDLSILFGIAAILSFILLFAQQPDGSRYFRVVTNEKGINFFKFNVWIEQVKQFATFFLNPLKSAHRVFIIKNSITLKGFFLCSVMIALIYSGIWQLRLKKEKVSFIILNISLFFLTLLLMSVNSRVWAMHHIVLSFPFLILALFYIYSKLRNNRIVLFLISLAIIINFNLYFDLGSLKYKDHDHPSKQKINTLVNKKFSGQYVFIVIDWGMYYLKALYGEKKQCVLYMEPLVENEQIVQIKKILDKTQRKAVFIGRSDSVSDLQLIKREFPGLVQLKTNFDTGKWFVWYDK